MAIMFLIIEKKIPIMMVFRMSWKRVMIRPTRQILMVTMFLTIEKKIPITTVSQTR